MHIFTQNWYLHMPQDMSNRTTVLMFVHQYNNWTELSLNSWGLRAVQELYFVHKVTEIYEKLLYNYNSWFKLVSTQII
jgi:hypothetical protein